MALKRPGLIDRARIAVEVFRRGLPAGLVVKEAPFAWPAWREGKPEWQVTDFASYVAQGFNANALIYSALMYKARALTVAPLRAYEGDTEHPTVLSLDHPLARLMARPNKFQSMVELMQASDVLLNIAGDAYIVPDRPRRGVLPTAMYSLRPDRVWIVPKNGQLIGYLYVPAGQTSSGLLLVKLILNLWLTCPSLSITVSKL